jgi:hypothetical protein
VLDVLVALECFFTSLQELSTNTGTRTGLQHAHLLTVGVLMMLLMLMMHVMLVLL